MPDNGKYCLRALCLVLIAFLWSGLMANSAPASQAVPAPLAEHGATDPGARFSNTTSRIENLGGGRFAHYLGAPETAGEDCAAFRRPDASAPALSPGWQYSSSRMEIRLPALADGQASVSTVSGDNLSFRLLGAGGGTLADYPFTPGPVAGTDQAMLGFGQVVDYVPGTAEVQIVRLADGRVLASEGLSANPPIVNSVALRPQGPSPENTHSISPETAVSLAKPSDPHFPEQPAAMATDAWAFRALLPHRYGYLAGGG